MGSGAGLALPHDLPHIQAMNGILSVISLTKEWARQGKVEKRDMMKEPTRVDAVQASAAPETTAASGVTLSRCGKRAWTVCLDPGTALQLKAVAALNDRSLQSLGEEAAGWLIERYYIL